ncbi:MAG: alpha/beta hydrolase, partial [Thermoanaerobaculia bacterium]|nr:alpha/beta hydrolase [Thermoanaerobaculia bacterium]
TIPLVLLHGFCEDSSVWSSILPKLRELRVVRIDLPGFGGSDLPLAPDMGAYAEAVCAVLNELDIAQCVLAGHSMGGYAALVFAQIYPERLSGLALVHSHPFEDSAERKENRRRGIDMLRAGKKDLYVAQLFPGLFAPAFSQEHPEVVESLTLKGRRQTEAGIVCALESMIGRADHQNTLKTAPCPVLLLGGEQDSIIPPDWLYQVADLPDVTEIHVLAGIGHMGMFDSNGRENINPNPFFVFFCPFISRILSFQHRSAQRLQNL